MSQQDGMASETLASRLHNPSSIPGQSKVSKRGWQMLRRLLASLRELWQLHAHSHYKVEKLIKNKFKKKEVGFFFVVVVLFLAVWGRMGRGLNGEEHLLFQENLGSILSTHKVAHNHQQFQFQGIWSFCLISMGTTRHACGRHAHMQTKHPYAYKSKAKQNSRKYHQYSTKQNKEYQVWRTKWMKYCTQISIRKTNE